MFGRGFARAAWQGSQGAPLLASPVKLRRQGHDKVVELDLAGRNLGQAAPQCPAGQFWDGKQCRASVGTNPQGGGWPAPNTPPPSPGTQASAPPAAPDCRVPPGFGEGGSPALACRMPDGSFNLVDYRSGATLARGLPQSCLSQFGNVTMATEGDYRCGGGAPMAPGTPTSKANASDSAELIGCWVSSGYYDLRNASDLSLVAAHVTTQQVTGDMYQGKRVRWVGMDCKASPPAAGGAGGAAAVPAPGAGAGAAPTPAPTQGAPGTTPTAGGTGAASTQPRAGGGIPLSTAGGMPGSPFGGLPGQRPLTTTPYGVQAPGQAPGVSPRPMGPTAVRPPVAAPLSQDVQRAITGWGAEPQALARALIQKYGRPDLVSSEHLVWKDRGQWYLTVLQNDQVLHNWPVPHQDFLYQVIRYPIDPKYYGDITSFDGSVILDRTLGFVGSMCGDEGMNFLAVNLAHDIAAGDLSVREAQAMFVEAYNQYKAGGAPAYTQGIHFPVSRDYAGNPGDPA